MKSFLKQIRILGLILIAGICTYSGYAQYAIVFTSGTTPETSVVAVNSAVGWLNNAVFTNSNGSLYGETWDENGGAVYLELHDNGFPLSTTGTVTLGSGLGGTNAHPDIVLGGDDGNNYVGVVYTNTTSGGSDVYLEVYTVTGVGGGSGTLTLSHCTTYQFNISGSQHAGNAHIDMAHEVYPTSLVKADRFAIVYENYVGLCFNAIPRPGAEAKSGTFSNLVACSGSTFISSGCLNIKAAGPNQGFGRDVDMAIRYDAVSGKYSADFTYWDDLTSPQTWIYAGRWNDITGANTVNQGVKLIHGSNSYIEFPRIDAYDSRPLSVSTANADIVYRWYDPGVPEWNVMQVNLLHPTGEEITKPYYDGTWINYNSKPVVTAGTEGYIGADYYRFYSVAYAEQERDTIYLQNIKHSDGLLFASNGTDPDYRIVNDSPLIAQPVAISNDYIVDNNSVFRPDQIYVSWYSIGHGSIDCKTNTSVAPVFRPTRTGNWLQSKAHVKVYPEPAQNTLTVEEAGKPISSYSLRDIMGREMLSGNISGSKALIDISGLARGLYLLNVHYRDDSMAEGITVTKE